MFYISKNNRVSTDFDFFSGGCSVIGAILIVIGLYSVLWGKHKEQLESRVEAGIPLPVNDAESSASEEENMVDARDNFTEEKHDQKVEPISIKFSSIVITLSIQESPTR